MTDLRTRYLGFELRSPIVASPGPLTGQVETLELLEEAGAAAVVLPSLFEEQVTHASLDLHDLLEQAAWSSPEASTYFPELEDYNTGPRPYLQLVEEAKQALTIPVIASLNAGSPGAWVGFAHALQEAGADALELNIYGVAADVGKSAAEVEQRSLDLVAAVRAAVSIPLAVKVGPYFSAMANMASRLVAAGADGLVLFNRFYQPDIDLEHLEVRPRLVLSSSEELRLPLRWIAILHGRVGASLAATTGVHTAGDVAKALLAGADVAMMTSALLTHGPEHVGSVERDLRTWMEEHAFPSVEDFKGSMSQRAVPDPEAFERANYMRTLTSFSASFRP